MDGKKKRGYRAKYFVNFAPDGPHAPFISVHAEDVRPKCTWIIPKKKKVGQKGGRTAFLVFGIGFDGKKMSFYPNTESSAHWCTLLYEKKMGEIGHFASEGGSERVSHAEGQLESRRSIEMMCNRRSRRPWLVPSQDAVQARGADPGVSAEKRRRARTTPSHIGSTRGTEAHGFPV